MFLCFLLFWSLCFPVIIVAVVLDVCLYSERKRWCGFGGCCSKEYLGRIGGGEVLIREHYIKKNYFQQKKEGRHIVLAS